MTIKNNLWWKIWNQSQRSLWSPWSHNIVTENFNQTMIHISNIMSFLIYKLNLYERTSHRTPRRCSLLLEFDSRSAQRQNLEFDMRARYIQRQVAATCGSIQNQPYQKKASGKGRQKLRHKRSRQAKFGITGRDLS